MVWFGLIAGFLPGVSSRCWRRRPRLAAPGRRCRRAAPRGRRRHDRGTVVAPPPQAAATGRPRPHRCRGRSAPAGAPPRRRHGRRPSRQWRRQRRRWRRRRRRRWRAWTWGRPWRRPAGGPPVHLLQATTASHPTDATRVAGGGAARGHQRRRRHGRRRWRRGSWWREHRDRPRRRRSRRRMALPKLRLRQQLRQAGGLLPLWRRTAAGWPSGGGWQRQWSYFVQRRRRATALTAAFVWRQGRRCRRRCWWPGGRRGPPAACARTIRTRQASRLAAWPACRGTQAPGAQQHEQRDSVDRECGQAQRRGCRRQEACPGLGGSFSQAACGRRQLGGGSMRHAQLLPHRLFTQPHHCRTDAPTPHLPFPSPHRRRRLHPGATSAPQAHAVDDYDPP